MTDSDLRTVRAWCAANGVTVVHNPQARPMWAWSAEGDMPEWIADKYKFYGVTEESVWRALGQVILPLIQSVRNLNSVEVVGPYKCTETSSGWWVERNGTQRSWLCGPMKKQSARTIANILNRESQQ